MFNARNTAKSNTSVINRSTNRDILFWDIEFQDRVKQGTGITASFVQSRSQAREFSPNTCETVTRYTALQRLSVFAIYPPSVVSPYKSRIVGVSSVPGYLKLLLYRRQPQVPASDSRVTILLPYR